MKRTLCLFLALILAVGICFSAPVTITASAATAESDFEYEENDGGITIYWYNGSDSEIVIPDTIDGKPVTIIDDIAFQECTALTSVTLPEGLTSIGVMAFSGCTELTEIIIPDSVKSIGVRAFYKCTSLETVKIGNGVETIGKESFSGCIALTSVTMGTSVKTIGESAFADCALLGEITIPDGVETIGDTAFYYCSSLETVTIPGSVETIGDHAFAGCSMLTSLTIPDSVTSIGNSAFSGCTALKTVNAPCSWNEKSLYTFKDGVEVAITKHEYENGVCEACGYECQDHTYEFAICTTCSYVCHHETVTDGVCGVCGGTYCGKTESDTVVYFYNESTKTLTISGEGEMADFTDTTMPWYSYRGEIATIVINKGVTSIGVYSFYNCKALTSVTIPESVTSIGIGAFYKCTSLPSVTIPSSVTTIESYAFYGCTSLTTIEIPDSVTEIGSRAFNDCTSLTTIEIPDSVTTIESYAFYGCTSLTTIEIPDSVTTIESYAFYGCTKLTSVSAPCSWNEKPLYTFEDGVAVNIERHTIENNACTTCEGSKCGATASDTVTWVYDEGTLYISGTGAMADFTNTTMPWYSYQSEIATIVINKGVTSIGAYSFYNCKALTSVTIPESVTSIGEYSFYYCLALTSVTIPESVTSIGNGAFYKCTALPSVTIPDSVTTIETYAFNGCTSLTTVTIPSSVTEIGSSAFSGCTSLTTIEIPDSVTEIGSRAFNGCTSLTTIEIPDSVTTIEFYAFNGCTSLTTIEIPDSVTTIGSNAFNGCTSLTTIEIPDSVTTIGANAFNNCTKLTTVSVPCSWNENPLYTFEDGVKVNIERHTLENNTCTVCEGSKCGATESDTVTWVYDEGTLYINGKGAMADFTSTNMPWYSYRSEIATIVINKGVTSIGAYSFCYCTALTSVTIPESVTTIGNNAFRVCTSLASVTIGDSVTTIGECAFYNCTSLTTIEIPDSVTTIGENAFYGCTSLASVTIGDSVTTIGEYAFYNCTALESIEIPDSVTTIGSRAFGYCTSLISVTIPENVTTIGASAFSDCTKLTTVNVPCNWDGSIYKFAESILKFADHDTTKTATCISKAECSVCGEYGDFAPHTYENGKGKCTVANCDNACAHETITDGVCVDCGGKHCGYTENDKVVWFYDGGTLTITGSGAMADYGLNNIPWGNYKSSITQINIENGVTTIAEFAFANCISLASVTIPDSVTSIGRSAFSTCTALTSVMIPEGVTTIDYCTFYFCTALKSVTIPESVTTIGSNAFECCTSLTSVTIPDSVTTIGSNAFYNCTKLISINVDGANTEYSSEDGVLFNSNKTELLCYPAGKKGNYEIPTTVTEIALRAFSGNTSLVSVIIPDSVTTIGIEAFYGCTALETVTILSSEIVIEANAFYDCPNVTLLVDENSNAHAYALEKNIKYITYVGGSGELGKLTFTPIYKEADNENSEITGYSVTTRDTSISGALTIPSKYNGYSVTAIGNGAFSNCKSLTSVVIPDSVVSLGEMAFYDCDSLETVTLSSNITVIPDEAFAYCESLKTLPITEKITSIGESAFYGSGKHSEVSLSNVTIGSSAFLQCGITELTLENCDLNGTKIFDNNTIEKLTLSETDIPDKMFYCDSYIKTLAAEDSVLGSMSFAGCTELENVTVSGGEIKSDAFLECPSLETVTIDNIDSVGENAFNNCQALKTVEVNATEISEYAFSMCTSLENVKLGDNVEIIGDAVFEGCASLAELELPETVTEIGKGVFNGCDLLTELVIPESVTEISYGAFWGCFNLKYIFFEGTEDSQKELGDALDTNAQIHYGSSTHTFEENYTVDVKPTCTEKGSESQHCKYCDLTQNERPIKENGHTSVNGGTEKAHTKCNVCKEVLSAEHEFASKITTAPTCTKEGVKTFTCECGYTYTAVVPATGHKEVTVTGKAATCTETGLTDGKKCSVCGVTTVEQKEIAALGHAYAKDFTTDKEPTYTEAGSKSKHCSRCDAKTEVTAIAKKVLATPTVSFTPTAKGFEINWNKVEGAQSYIVYKKTYNASTKKWSGWSRLKSGVTSTSCTDTSVKLGSYYKYTVKAVNGKETSTFITLNGKKYNVTPDVKVAVASNGIKVSWSTAANATGYTVYSSTYNTKTKKWSGWTNRGTTKANATSWVDKKVKSGTKYRYTVKAMNDKVGSAYNKNGAATLYLAQPTVKIANNASGVKLSWNKIAGATGYTVYRSELSNGKWTSWKNMGTIKKNSTVSWVDKSVKSGTQYRYTVRAINGSVKSTYKASNTLLYLAQPTTTVKAVSNGINVAWSQCEGATGYTVYRSEYNTKTEKWSGWKSMGTAKSDKKSWTDKSAKKGVIYKYTVRSVNADTGAKSSYVASKNVKR